MIWGCAGSDADIFADAHPTIVHEDSFSNSVPRLLRNVLAAARKRYLAGLCISIEGQWLITDLTCFKLELAVPPAPLK